MALRTPARGPLENRPQMRSRVAWLEPPAGGAGGRGMWWLGATDFGGKAAATGYRGSQRTKQGRSCACACACSCADVRWSNHCGHPCRPTIESAPSLTSSGAQHPQAQVLAHGSVAQHAALWDAQHLRAAEEGGADGRRGAGWLELHEEGGRGRVGRQAGSSASTWKPQGRRSAGPGQAQHRPTCPHLADRRLGCTRGGGGERQNALRLHAASQSGTQPEVGGSEGVAPLCSKEGRQ